MSSYSSGRERRIAPRASNTRVYQTSLSSDSGVSTTNLSSSRDRSSGNCFRQSSLYSSSFNSFDDQGQEFIDVESSVFDSVLQSSSGLNTSDYQPGLCMDPIVIFPMDNLGEYTPSKYHDELDDLSLSVSSLNESLDVGEGNVSINTNLDTPSFQRNAGATAKRKEYIFSRRLLGALGAGGIITSTPSSRGRASTAHFPQIDRFSPFREANRIIQQGGQHFKVFPSAQKVKRSESVPDPFAPCSADLTMAFEKLAPISGKKRHRLDSLPPLQASRNVSVTNFREEDGFFASDHLQEYGLNSSMPASISSRRNTDLFVGSPLRDSDRKRCGVRTKLIFSPSKNGKTPVLKVKRSAPGILNRKGRMMHKSANMTAPCGHFTPSKFFSNPLASTPVSKRLRDRKDSTGFLPSVNNSDLTSPQKILACKKQIFADFDDPVPSSILTPPTSQPVSSFENVVQEPPVDDYQIGFDNIASNELSLHPDSAFAESLVSMDTPSKLLQIYPDENQLFASGTIPFFAESPVEVKTETSQSGKDKSNPGFVAATASGDVGFSKDDLGSFFFDDQPVDSFAFPEMEVVVNSSASFKQDNGGQFSRNSSKTYTNNYAADGYANSRAGNRNVNNYPDYTSGKFTQKNHLKKSSSALDSSLDRSLPTSFKAMDLLSLDQDRSNAGSSLHSFYFCGSDNVIGEVLTTRDQSSILQYQTVCQSSVAADGGEAKNGLQETFMKVACCLTTHKESLLQQAKEMLGVVDQQQQISQ